MVEKERASGKLHEFLPYVNCNLVNYGQPGSSFCNIESIDVDVFGVTFIKRQGERHAEVSLGWDRIKQTFDSNEDLKQGCIELKNEDLSKLLDLYRSVYRCRNEVVSLLRGGSSESGKE